jgi:hypothetical protein
MPVKTKKKTQAHMVNGLVVWGVPKQVRLDFKAACARKGSSMRVEILRFLGQFTEKNK